MSKQAAQNTTNQITEGVIWKQLLIFFFPILFGTFFQQLYNTADAIIVGNFVGKEALAGVGVGVTAIGDAVQVNFFCTQMLCHFQHAEPVVGMAVDAAGADQTHQVDGLARVDGSLHVLDQHGVLEHLAVADGLGDEGQLLVDDAASAQVAHLTVGQTDCHAGGVNGGHGVFCHQGIDEGLVGCGHGIAVGLVGGPAKAIHDTEQNRFFGHKNESPLKVQQTAPGSLPEMRRSRAQRERFLPLRA